MAMVRRVMRGVPSFFLAHLDRDRASFETATSWLPQDEEVFLMPSTMVLMLRSSPKGCVSKHAGCFRNARDHHPLPHRPEAERLLEAAGVERPGVGVEEARR